MYVIAVVPWVLAEEDGAVNVHYTLPPTPPRQDDVQGALEHGWEIYQTEWHVRVSEGSHVTFQHILVMTSLRNRHLPELHGASSTETILASPLLSIQPSI